MPQTPPRIQGVNDTSGYANLDQKAVHAAATPQIVTARSSALLSLRINLFGTIGTIGTIWTIWTIWTICTIGHNDLKDLFLNDTIAKRPLKTS